MISAILPSDSRSAWQAFGLSLLPPLADRLVSQLFSKRVSPYISEGTAVLAGVVTYTFLISKLPVHSSFKIMAPAFYLAYKAAQYFWCAKPPKPSTPPPTSTLGPSARAAASLHSSGGAAPAPLAVEPSKPPSGQVALPAIKPAPMPRPYLEPAPTAAQVLAAASPPADRKKIDWEIKNVALLAIPLMEFITVNGSNEEEGIEEGIYRVSGKKRLVDANLYYLDCLYLENATFNTERLFLDLKLYEEIPRAASICKALFGRLKDPLLQPIMSKFMKSSKELEAFKKLEAKQPGQPSKKLEKAKESVEAKFTAALSELDKDRKNLLHATLLHLKYLAGIPAHRMDSNNLAMIFTPLFFNIPQTTQVKALEQVQRLTTGLAYLIDQVLIFNDELQN